MEERTPQEVSSGMDQRSNDYLDGVNDMILFLQAFDLTKEEDRECLERALQHIDGDMNAIRMMRFIRANVLDKFR